LTVVLGLVLALLSAGALNWGFFAQHTAASTLPPLSLRHPVSSLASLFRSVEWLVGFLCGLGGWALYVCALALAPLSLVQASSAGGIGLLALLVSRRGTVLSERERFGVGSSIAGLALLGISLAGGSAGGRPGSAAAVAAWLAASCALAATAAGPAARLLTAGAGLGVAAGVLYAAGDVASKAAVHGGLALAFVPAVLTAHGLAFVALQLSFQRGGALATIGVSTLLTNALPIIAGLAIYGETLPGGALGIARAIAFVLVVVGAGALATRERALQDDGRRLSRWTPSTSSSPSCRTEIAPRAGTGATRA
jgi:hypothetical protein